MDENSYEHNHEHHCWHKFWKHLLTWLMALIGAFLAFYVVSDWHFKRMYDPVYQMKRMDKAMNREAKYAEKSMKNSMHNQIRAEEKADKLVHIEKGINAYKVIVNLKAFDNNEKNVETSVNGNSLTVTAAGVNPKKDDVIRISETYDFGNNVDLKELTKQREGDKYIITIPID